MYPRNYLMDYRIPNELGSLGAILLPTQYLVTNQQYTFTFQKGGYFSFSFEKDEDILKSLRERMGNYGHILSVNRPLFSNRWVVVAIPYVRVTVQDWESAFDVSWRDMGFDTITFLQVEGGAESTVPGGVSQTLPDVGKLVGGVAGGAVGPILGQLLPYALILGLGYIAITSYSKRRSF